MAAALDTVSQICLKTVYKFSFEFECAGRWACMIISPERVLHGTSWNLVQ